MNAVQNLLRPTRRGGGAEAVWRRLGLQDSPVLNAQSVCCWLRRAALYHDLAAYPARATQPDSKPGVPAEPRSADPEGGREVSMTLALKRMRGAEPTPYAGSGKR